MFITIKLVTKVMQRRERNASLIGLVPLKAAFDHKDLRLGKNLFSPYGNRSGPLHHLSDKNGVKNLMRFKAWYIHIIYYYLFAHTSSHF